MTKKLLITAIFLFGFFTLGHAQNNVVAFYEYDIKSGMKDQFTNGYAKDLEWHKSQGDNWSWIGWFVMNGNRRTRFIDATPNHTWSDFDNWNVNGAENSRHNKIYWLPYVENLSGSYKVILEDYSKTKPGWYLSNYQQVYTIKINPAGQVAFNEFLSLFQKYLGNRLENNSFVWMKTVSGGEVNAYQLFVSIDRIESLKKLEKLFVFDEKLSESYSKSVSSNSSELWKFSKKLTLISE